MSQNAPQPATSDTASGDTGAGLSQFLTRILDQLSISSWLPAIMVVANLALLLELHSQRNLDIGQAIITLTKAPLGTLIVLVLAIVVTSIVTQAFEFAAIRLLEGYWGSLRLTTVWSSRRIRRHTQRFARLSARYDGCLRTAFSEARDRMLDSGVPRELVEVLDKQRRGEPLDGTDPAIVGRAEQLGWQRYAPPELLHRVDAIDSLLAAYPRPHRIMPTELGNILRSREDQLTRDPGEPLDEFVMRRYQLLTPDLSAQHRDARSQLNIYCLLTLIFLGLAVLSLAVLIPGTANPAGAAAFAAGYALLSGASYRAATACARRYTSVLQVINALSAASGAP